MIEHKISNDFSSQPALYFDYLLNQLKNHYAQNISDWAQCGSSNESLFLACSTSWISEIEEINCKLVYRNEKNQPMSRGSKSFNLSQIYYTTRMDTLEQRLLQAGVRLAAVINKIVESTDEDKKSDKPCFATILLMIVLFIQSILILALLYYSFLRRKPTTITELPVITDKKEYLVKA
jgi:hypothetical protein